MKVTTVCKINYCLFEKRNIGLYCLLARSGVEAVWAMGGSLCSPAKEELKNKAVSLLLISPNTHLGFVCELVFAPCLTLL